MGGGQNNVIPLNSFFGPVIEVNSFPDIFLGDYGETVIKSVEFHNVGDATAYLDSIYLPEYFEYEPFGEDNFILPNDSSLPLHNLSRISHVPQWEWSILF